MKTSSPLRYPGGKSAMTGLLAHVRRMNGVGDLCLAEPFAGGAGASLTLLYLEETPNILINDADPAIHDFWWAVTYRSSRFLSLLRSKRVNMTEWRRQRDLYRKKSGISRLRRGFATFYLNRCNRSGIIMNGGPIGGVKQTGQWRIDARYNKPDLQKRCQKVAQFKDRISVSGIDGLRFIETRKNTDTFFFIDPPYFEKGKTLYLNALDYEYHSALARLLKSMKDCAWILTYDDCPQIRSLYKGWANIRTFNLRYAAADRRDGNEVLIVPRWMRLPRFQSSAAIAW